jgi:hypothetical protein
LVKIHRSGEIIPTSFGVLFLGKNGACSPTLRFKQGKDEKGSKKYIIRC